MTVDRTEIVEYPFTGAFYRITVDKSGGLKQVTTKKELVLETECDVQNAHSAIFTSTTYTVYFPITLSEGTPVRVGDSFEATIAGITVNGVVSGVYPSQLGGCLAYLKDYDA